MQTIGGNKQRYPEVQYVIRDEIMGWVYTDKSYIEQTGNWYIPAGSAVVNGVKIQFFTVP